MDQQDPHDPFAGLEQWAKETERKIQRERRRPRLRRALLLVAVAAVAAALLAAVLPAMRSLLAPGDATAAYPTQGVPGGISATSSASAAPSDPFAGTPAAAYPKGEAGITLPAAKPVAGFTAAQVGSALGRVRAALIAGRLASSMLTGHDPQPYLALLAKNQRGQIGTWFKSAKFTSLATWIDPAVRLDPAEQPRVSGRVSYASTTVDGLRTLRVTTNFVWVYAFTGADHPLAAAHEEIRWEFPATKNLRAGDHGMWIADARSYLALVDCAAAAKGLLAPTRPDTAAPGPRSTEDDDNYLRADHSLEITNDCPTPSPSA